MKTLAILLAALPLSACISFGAEPPPSLLTLTSAAAVPVGQTQSSGAAQTITISVPSTPQELSVARVPVRSTDTSIAYVKDAQWVEPPARLFARLLADTMTTRTGRVVLSGRQSNVDPGALLSGELRSFGFEAATSEAVVTYDGALLRKDATAFEKRRFEARVPVTAIDAANAGVALNQAANQVAAEVADWVGR
ncbi:ABC-type transport auxiliary lipoprotein family protein [Sphingomonas sp. S1-29]|uniref:ABC-type transport auxiliary lipoprotein family protein n=1 Tax=Sphingomonas sp. S1-29 TaxID=2991074 RepID=UPI00223F4085|nr:ABC-type transport auxiliary lipoprotein family protein [Sphingomonas sp. S1-29]UZK68407.1 ABC-type transport auxiliary lipoprotein family protein [Sphingomonas sp. S1-29]